MENIINSREIITKRRIKGNESVVFCEFVREKRVKIVAKEAFGENYDIKTMAVDFDTSDHRYLSPEFLRKKENLEIKHSLWALNNPENLKKHQEMFAEKIDYIRNESSKIKGDVIKAWWEKKMQEFE